MSRATNRLLVGRQAGTHSFLGGLSRGWIEAPTGAVGMQNLPGASGWASWRKGQQEQTLIRTGMDGKVTCSVLLREREGAPEDFENQDVPVPGGVGKQVEKLLRVGETKWTHTKRPGRRRRGWMEDGEEAVNLEIRLPLTFKLIKIQIIDKISHPETGLFGQPWEQSGQGYVLPSLWATP